MRQEQATMTLVEMASPYLVTSEHLSGVSEGAVSMLRAARLAGALWLAVRETIAGLSRLDDRILRDIGIERADIVDIAKRMASR